MKLIWIFLIAIPIGFAQEHMYVIEDATILVDLERKEEVYHINVTSIGGRLDSFDVSSQELLSAFSAQGEPLEIIQLQGHYRVYFDRAISAGETYPLMLKTRHPEMLKETRLYFKSFSVPVPVKNFNFVLRLPKGMYPDVSTLKNPPPNCCIISSFQASTTIPPDDILMQDERMTLTWQRTLAPGEKFEIGFILPEKTSAYPPVVIAALALAISIGYVLVNRSKKARAIQVFLTEEEKLILDFIRKNGGRVLQEEIWKSASIPFSRPKVSRLIADLEGRGVITRKPYKKTFKVNLNL